jgi:hypothetical protein
MGKKKINENEIISKYMNEETVLNYKTSWDVLMPVVIKINNSGDNSRPFVYGKPENVSLEICGKFVKITSMFWSNPDSVNGNHWVNLNKVFKYDKYSPLEATYEAVIAFILWFNTHKK